MLWTLIEAELVNIKNKHGKRVAYISICMAEYWKIQGDELQDLAMFHYLRCTRSGGILKQATMSRKPSGHFVVIWYEAARVLIIKL